MLTVPTNREVLVIGDVMLDKYIIGNVHRISPEAPVPVVLVSTEEYRIGGCGNVAHNLSNLAIDTTLFSVIGADESGEILKRSLNNKNIKSALYTDNIATTSKMRVIGQRQQIVRLDYEQIYNEPQNALAQFEQLVKQHTFKLFILSDYNKGFCSEALCQAAINYATQQKLKAIIDPKGTNWSKYNGAFMITPNLKELSAISNVNIPNTDDAVAFHGQQLLQNFDFQYLLVTRSEKGISLISRHQTKHFPTTTVDVFDVSGAGDTVVAVVAAALVRSVPLPQAIQYANSAAGYVVSKFGTYAITKKDMEKLHIDLDAA